MLPLTLFAPAQAGPSPRAGVLATSSRRRLRTTAAFRSYWHLASERQAMLFRRLRGDAVLTDDWILRAHRFTNAYRAADRVSQYVINEVLPGTDGTAEDVVFRALLFKLFNRIETWRSLELGLGEPVHWSNFSVPRYDAVLTEIVASGGRIYSNAYIMPNPPFGHRFKHTNHLTLLDALMRDDFAHRVVDARDLRALYDLLVAVPSFGPFLAFQYAIDLNYSEICSFDEMGFVVPGPGAIDGIRKCFEDVAGYCDADVIKIMADVATQQFEELGLEFRTLWGRPLQLIDCQNLFCEVGKYARLAHPELVGVSGRARIKQRYVISKYPLPRYSFPNAWGLDVTQPFADVSPVSL
jgi:alpha-glutamyl/putrescinyl thymine pyrophosphorylase clade 1